MTTEQLDRYKSIAVDLYTDFYNYEKGECSLDKALENVAFKLKGAFDKHPIVGYVKSGTVNSILYDIFKNKRQNEEKSYLFDCKIHRNELDTIERILKQQ